FGSRHVPARRGYYADPAPDQWEQTTPLAAGSAAGSPASRGRGWYRILPTPKAARGDQPPEPGPAVELGNG
ncbi:MAG: hypothetical protein KAR01_09485, partial [Desulfocapsa sp.]|nr:hypothetical protein [Desulfocapsa sp.]